MKYVVIGNGIMALSAAFRLMGRIGSNDSITIIGPSVRPGSATLAAAAMLNCFAEIETHSLKSEADRRHFDLSRQAAKIWPEFERDLIAAAGATEANDIALPPISPRSALDRGTYVINNAATSDLDDRNFDAIAAALDQFTERFERPDPRDIPNYHPDQLARASRALFIPNEGWLNPRLIVDLLDTTLRQASCIRLEDAAVLKLNRSGSIIASVDLDNGTTLQGDVFLLANGASFSNLLAGSELDLEIQPVFYGVGLSMEIVSPDYAHTKCIRTPNRGGACGIYTVPLFLGANASDDHIIIGASNFISPKPFTYGRVISVAHLLENACREINRHFFDAQLVRVNVGWRPTTQDTYPLLGRSSIANLVVATGTKRDGFHLAPVLSEIIASIMIGEPADPRIAMFAPQRKPIRDLSRGDAIDMGVESLLSQHYQHGYHPSAMRMDDQLRKSFRDDLETLHDQVGAIDWGIHPELLNMYRRGFAR